MTENTTQKAECLSHLSAELGTTSDEQWQKIAPNKDGLWLMKCGENDHEAEAVDVKLVSRVYSGYG